ncbi:MAG: sulfotransferase [Bacteroidota bacterium]
MMRRIQSFAKSKGWIPPKRFLLLCHQRSGSNMLTSILNQHSNIELYGQLFKDDADFQARTHRLGVTPFNGDYFDDEIVSRERFDGIENTNEQPKRNTATFVNEVFTTLGKKRCAHYIGIKVHGGTLFTSELNDIFLDGNYRILILHRQDRLAAAISWYQARALNQWMRTNDQQVKRPQIEMNIDTLEWFMQRISADVSLWQNLVQSAHIPHLTLTYEELTAGDFDFSTIWQFLGVSDIGSPPSRTKKLIKDYSHIKNIRAIRSRLGQYSLTSS